jgi:hypothetical protein
MLHATGGAPFSTKSLLRSVVADEPLTEYFDGDRSIDQQMSRAIDRPHPAATEPLIQPVFLVEDAVQQRIDGNIGNRRIGLKGRLIGWTDEHIVRKPPAASGTLEHR